ncbi:MAG: hypothetical protein ACK4UN_03130 [Limisphaerales bacterium]
MSEQQHTTEAARQILEMLRSTYVPTHEYQTSDLKNYPHVDRGFYDRTRALLESEGFIYLEDSEDMSLAAVKGNVFKPVPIRCMVSNDGVIMAGIYHAKISAIWLRVLLFILRKRVGKTIDLETEFLDGSFVCTSNAAMAGAMKLPQLIDSELHPIDTPCAVLLERHRARVLHHIKQHSAAPVKIRTTAELRESQNRMNALKAAFRGELGGISMEELEKLSFTKTQAREVYDAAQKIKNEG